MEKYCIVFDEVMKKQLEKVANDVKIKEILKKMFDKIELLGPLAGKLLDSHAFIYEVKCKRPPIRLYYNYEIKTNEIIIFEYEMKTSEKKQQKTIEGLRRKLKS